MCTDRSNVVTRIVNTELAVGQEGRREKSTEVESRVYVELFLLLHCVKCTAKKKTKVMLINQWFYFIALVFILSLRSLSP